MQENNDSFGDPTKLQRNWPLILAFIVVELYIAYWVFGRAMTRSGKYLNFFAIAFGAFVAISYLALVVTRRSYLIRLAIDFAAVMFVLFGYSIPAHRADLERQAEDLARAERLKVADQADEIKLNAWLVEMKKSGNHGLPGVVPPMLKVEDNGTIVRVQNISDTRIVAALARVREDQSAPGGWKGCGMYTDFGGRGGACILSSLLLRTA
jgi:hypothetical protein